MVDIQPQTPVANTTLHGDIGTDNITLNVPLQVGSQADRLTNKLRSPPSVGEPAEKRIRLEYVEGINSSEPQSDIPGQPTLFFKFGPYVPIVRDEDRLVLDPKGIVYSNKSGVSGKRNSSEVLCVLPDDAIVEAPSLVTPLLLKKKTVWPNEKTEINSDESSKLPETGRHKSPDSDDIQIVKEVSKDSAQDNVNSAETSNSGGDKAAKFKPVEEYIKATTVSSLTANKTSNTKSPVLIIDDYYNTSAGKLLFGIGLSRVTEFTLERDVIKLVKKIRRSSTGCPEMIEKLESLREQLSQARASNNVYTAEQKFSCHCCPFKSDSEVVLLNHLEKPHRLQTKKYSCNWCDFKASDPGQVVIHSLIEHKQRCRSEKPPVLHSCVYCPYETNSKRKLVTHHARCEHSFPHNSFLGPEDYGERDYPAITSKFITQADIRCYEQTLGSLRLATYNPYQLKVPIDQNNHRSLLVVPKQNGRNREANSKTKQKQNSPLGQMGNLGASFLPNNLALNPLRSDTVLLGGIQSPSSSSKGNTAQGRY